MGIERTSRRHLLLQAGHGFGGLALADLLARESAMMAGPSSALPDRLAEAPKAKVKRIIQLFMTGGASPMDTFDYKPQLERLDGQMLGPKEKPEGFTAPAGAIMKSPFRFARHGQSGRWVSSVFPEQAKLVDEMAFLMAMTTKTNVHGPGTYMMNSGFLLPGFPCMGAWISYALGNLVDNLPTFVVLPDARGLPYNQKGCFSAGFLPSIHEGVVLDEGEAKCGRFGDQAGIEISTGKALSRQGQRSLQQPQIPQARAPSALRQEAPVQLQHLSQLQPAHQARRR